MFPSADWFTERQRVWKRTRRLLPAPVQVGIKTATPGRWLILDLETEKVYTGTEEGEMHEIT